MFLKKERIQTALSNSCRHSWPLLLIMLLWHRKSCQFWTVCRQMSAACSKLSDSWKAVWTGCIPTCTNTIWRSRTCWTNGTKRNPMKKKFRHSFRKPARQKRCCFPCSRLIRSNSGAFVITRTPTRMKRGSPSLH